MLCILYVIAVGTLLGVAGVLVERALPAGFPRRWVWCVVIPMSVFLPGYYRWHHTVTIANLQMAMQPTIGHTLAGPSFGTAWVAALDPGVWTRIQSFDKSINWVWLTVSALLVIWGLGNAWRVSRVIRVSRRGRSDAEGPAIIDGVPVVVTDSMGPATVGLLRSRVVVPRWVLALPGVQRRYVLCHEEQHRNANDARLLFVASLTLLLVPWNLALWWQLRRLRLAVEMDCDNRVVASVGDATAYGELLLKVALAASHGPRLQPALLGVGMLERRVTALLTPTPLRQVQRFLLPAVACVLLFVVLSLPHPVLGSHPQVTHTAQAAEVIVPKR